MASHERFELDIGIETLRTESRWIVELASELDSDRDLEKIRNRRVVPAESEDCRYPISVAVGISTGSVSRSFVTCPRVNLTFYALVTLQKGKNVLFIKVMTFGNF